MDHHSSGRATTYILLAVALVLLLIFIFVFQGSRESEIPDDVELVPATTNYPAINDPR